MLKIIIGAMLVSILFAGQQIAAGAPSMNFLDMLKIASKQKDSKSSNFLLGVVYLNGDESTKQDIPKAIEHFKRDVGNLSYSSYMLGFISATGYDGVEPDYNKAIEYFTNAYKLESAPDNKEVGPVALAAIGHIYLDKLEQPKEALAFLLQSSKLKNIPNVDFVIALIYHTEESIKDENLAEYYLNRAYNSASDEERNYMNKYVVGGADDGQTEQNKEDSCLK